MSTLQGTPGVVSVEKLRVSGDNYNRQSAFVFDKLLRSIREFGFVDPLDVRSGDQNGPFPDGSYEIIGGEHRYRAAIKLDMEEVPVNDLGEVPDAVAKPLMIVLNETRGKPDEDALSALVKQIEADGDSPGLAVLPFDESFLSDLLDAEADDDDSLDDLDDHSLGGDEPEPARLKSTDVAAMLDMAGLSQDQLQLFFDRIRRWAAGACSDGTPAWQRLMELLVDNTEE